MKPQVLIYRSDWLRPTEDFVREHAGQLTRYRAVTMGLRQPQDHPASPPPDHWVTGSPAPSRMQRARFRAFGQAELPDALRPRLIHAHSTVDALEMLPWARRWSVPLLVTLHGQDVTEKGFRFDRARLHWLLQSRALHKGATAYLAASAYLRHAAVQAGFPAGKLLVHYPGTALPGAHPLGIEDRRGLLFVGPLVRQKGLLDVLGAMSLLKTHNIMARLDVIGEGPLREKIENDAKLLGLDIHVHGTLSYSDTHDALSRARAVLMPVWQGGFGLVALEAQATGTPVIAYEHGAFAETIVHGKTGLLIEPGNVEGLAHASAALLTNDTLWKSCSNDAARHVGTNFDRRRQTEALERLYDRLIA